MTQATTQSPTRSATHANTHATAPSTTHANTHPKTHPKTHGNTAATAPATNHPAHPFIAIEGPIGVGKTTVARHLAEHLKAQFLPDTDTVNPYLKQFYIDPKAVALHAQMHFLVARREILKKRDIEQPVRPIIADFMIDKDRLFAELTLDENEWWMYSHLYDRMTEDTRRPNLVIYLQAPLERLIERIEKRGLRHEQRIDSTYLAELGARYERFFHDYDESSLLIVKADEVNLASDQSAVKALASLVQSRLQEGDGSRHFWNPAG